MWRTEYSDKSYDEWATTATNGTFAAPTRVDSIKSPGAPPDYVAGDDTGTVTVVDNTVYVAWADWRSGTNADIWWGGFPITP